MSVSGLCSLEVCCSRRMEDEGGGGGGGGLGLGGNNMTKGG